MAPHIDDIIYADLATSRNLTNEAYLAHVEAFSFEDSVPVFSMEGRVHLASALTSNNRRSLVLLHSTQISAKWRYSQIKYDQNLAAEILFCPSQGILAAELPPTLGEILLIDAWLGRVTPIENHFSSVIVAHIHNKLCSAETISALLASFGCYEFSSSFRAIQSFSQNKTEISFGKTSRFKKHEVSYSKLLISAAKENDPKWRFFQFYRILEQGYLQNILEIFSATFLYDPDQTVKSAKSAISNEQSQLLELIKSAQIGHFAEFILEDIDEAARHLNRYANVIKKKVAERTKGDRLESAAAAIYSIRCSIAHAGVRDIYYEQYTDADLLLFRILPALEEMVYYFLGLSYSKGED